jgi:hypothetical protein
MTKWHAIFRCKSRLAKDIGAFKAAKIQEKLTNHTINVAKKIQKEGLADIKVAIDGIGIKAAKKWAVLNKIKTVEIQGPFFCGLNTNSIDCNFYICKTFFLNLFGNVNCVIR